MAKLLVAFRIFPNVLKLYLAAEHGVRIFLFTICLTMLSIYHISLNLRQMRGAQIRGAILT